MRILVLTKRQYMNKDLLDHKYGRFREIPFQLARRGHTVHGLCLSYHRREEGSFRDGFVEWESFNAGRQRGAGLLRFISRALKLAQSHDVIWACSDSLYGIFACMAGSRYRTPVVFDLYDNFEFYLAARIPVLKQLYHWALKRCDAVTCISGPLARLVEATGRRGPTHVAPNAVREDLFYPMDKRECRKRLGLPTERILIGTAGSLYQNRGIPYLLKAFEQVAAKHPEVCLALAGQRGSDLHIPDRPSIRYLGVLNFEAVPVFLNALDVAVVCNLENAFGLYCHPQKAVEIMACNIPLVSACLGSMEELFQNRAEWLYVPDDPADLAKVLENRLLDQRTDYGEILTWQQIAVIVEKVLKEAVF